MILRKVKGKTWAQTLIEFDFAMVPPGECVEFQGSLDTSGYGLVRRSGVLYKAHRFTYQVARGSIAEGLVLDHLCRNTKCVHPDHLEAVTDAVNIRRGKVYKGSEATCKNGHPWRPETTSARTDGSRRCLICHRGYEGARYHARKASRVAA